MNYIVDKKAYLSVISHNPKYDKYNVGNMALYLTINELIHLGIEEYHLLWGDGKYKTQFRADKYNLNSFVLCKESCYQVSLLPEYYRHTKNFLKYKIKKFLGIQ